MAEKQVSVRIKAEGAGQVKAELQGIGAEAERSFGRMRTAGVQGGTGLQNVGFQVQDFAVQVGAGTSASQALGQQLPQLLSGFGIFGVLLGTVAAVAIPLFKAFGMGVDESEALTASIKSLGKAMKELDGATDAAQIDPTKLFGDFGAGAEQAAEVLEIQRQIAAARAENALGKASSATVALFGDPRDFDTIRNKIAEVQAAIDAARADPNALYTFDFGQATRDLERLKGRLENDMSDIASSLGIAFEGAEAEVLAVSEALRSFEGAEGARAQADAMADLRASILDAVEAGGEVSDEALALLEHLTGAELAALGLATIDLASPIGAGADEAARLAANLFAASKLEYGKVANAGGVDTIARENMAKYTPDPFGTLAGGAGGVFKAPKGKGGGGGGVNQAEREAARIYDQTRTAAEKYKIELAELNDLHASGKLDTDTYNRAVKKLGEDLNKTGDLGKKAASAIRGAFDNLFDDPAEALRNLAKQLAQMALYSALAKGMPNIFGGGGIIPLMNANGNAFDGGMVQAFASGGVVSGATMFPMRGGMGMMGEAGPEAIMPLTRIGGKLGVAAAGGGGVVVKHEVHNYSGGPVTTEEAKGPNGEKIIRTMVGKDLAGGKHDAALRGRFGSRPAPVKR